MSCSDSSGSGPAPSKTPGMRALSSDGSYMVVSRRTEFDRARTGIPLERDSDVDLARVQRGVEIDGQAVSQRDVLLEEHETRSCAFSLSPVLIRSRAIPSPESRGPE